MIKQGTKQDEQTSRDNVNYSIDRSSASIQFNKEEQTGDGKTGVDVDRDSNNSVGKRSEKDEQIRHI